MLFILWRLIQGQRLRVSSVIAKTVGEQGRGKRVLKQVEQASEFHCLRGKAKKEFFSKGQRRLFLSFWMWWWVRRRSRKVEGTIGSKGGAGENLLSSF